jgi:lipopolysaccharide transport system permease protein
MTSGAQSERPTVVYTPESPIRRPRALAVEMARDLRASRVLAWRLLRRDLSALYRQTIFGYLWALIPALITTLVWIVLNSTKFVSIETGDIPYPVYALTGSVFWFLFVDALNAPLRQLSGNRSMVNRVNFPTEALILSGIGQVLFSFAIKLALLAVLVIAYWISIPWTVVFLVIPTLTILAVGTAVGLLLLPIGLLYRDVEQALLALVAPLMFLTPVVYPPPGGPIGKIMDVNPLTPLFTAVRDVLYAGSLDSLSGESALVLGATLVLAAVAWVVYHVALPVLVERMEA